MKFTAKLQLGRMESTDSREPRKIRLQIQDDSSRCVLMELEFDGAAFAEAVVFSKHEIEGEGELIPAGIKNVGKKQEREDFTCTLTEQGLIAAGWPAGNEGFYYREKRHAIYQRAVQTLLDEVKPGWEAGGYFGSKDSVGTERDGRIPVKCSIYRYVSP